MTQITEIIQTIGPVGLATILGIGICAVSAGYLLLFGLCRISHDSDTWGDRQ